MAGPELQLKPCHGCLHPAAASAAADFACGVVGADGRHVLLDQGSLPAAVTASAAIPVVFSPVAVPGVLPLLSLLLGQATAASLAMSGMPGRCSAAPQQCI